MSVELVHVYRGNQVESIHRGDVVILDSQGIIASYGDPYKRTFWRSSAKPFQVIPFIEIDGLEHYKISEEELAIMTASHGGEEKHVKCITNLLKKMNFTVNDLDCGVSAPMHSPSMKNILRNNQNFTPAHNPCSGKHSGMLGLLQLKSWPIENYIQKDHPVQIEMLKVISKYTELPEKDIDIAIDGCGVPVFGLPIYNMALAYIKLLDDSPIMKRIFHAMTTKAFYVAGSDRLDTIIMEATNGQLLAKLGAESVYCIAGRKKSLALKIEDGGYRALNALVPELLLKHEFITKVEFETIQEQLPLHVKNHRKEVVGTYQTLLDSYI